MIIFLLALLLRENAMEKNVKSYSLNYLSTYGFFAWFIVTK